MTGDGPTDEERWPDHDDDFDIRTVDHCHICNDEAPELRGVWIDGYRWCFCKSCLRSSTAEVLLKFVRSEIVFDALDISGEPPPTPDALLYGAAPSEPMRRSKERASLTDSLRYRVLIRDHCRCALCGATAKNARLVIDHVIPVSRGGRTVVENLRVLCSRCNSGKGSSVETR